MKSMWGGAILLTLLFASASTAAAFSVVQSTTTTSKRRQPTQLEALSRRDAVSLVVASSLSPATATAAMTAITTITAAAPGAAHAAEEEEGTLPQVTDRVYIDLKSPLDPEAKRLVIGLYGKDAPRATSMLKQLFSAGLPAPCKPRDEARTLQKEQLEANKVHSACVEGESRGVTYEYGTVWRIVRDRRIDVGSVSGKFIARQFPDWPKENELAVAAAGTVSVQVGNESGFGFVIHPTTTNANADNDNENNSVVGRILEGSDVVAALNEAPVVTSSKVGYMALTGNTELRSAPSRACAYGSANLYCNEFKPLQKISIVSTGVL